MKRCSSSMLQIDCLFMKRQPALGQVFTFANTIFLPGGMIGCLKSASESSQTRTRNWPLTSDEIWKYTELLLPSLPLLSLPRDDPSAQLLQEAQDEAVRTEVQRHLQVQGVPSEVVTLRVSTRYVRTVDRYNKTSPGISELLLNLKWLANRLQPHILTSMIGRGVLPTSCR